MRHFVSTLGFILAGLILTSCVEGDFTDTDVANDVVKMYQYLCDGRNSCLNQLNQNHQDCVQHLDQKTKENVMTFNDPYMLCFSEGLVKLGDMDEAFEKRFDQVFSIKETEVSMTRGPTSSNHLVLKLEGNQATFMDQTVSINELEAKLKSLNLSEHYSSVVIVADNNGDTGDLIQAMDALKRGGISDISLTIQ